MSTSDPLPIFVYPLVAWCYARLLDIEQALFGSEEARPAGAVAPTAQPQALAPPPRKSLPALTGLLSKIQGVLARKRQVILYGPPGTGKTFWAERAVRELAARAVFRIPFHDLSEDQQKQILGGDGSGFVRVCSFHPAYGYEDFMEGYRPVAHGNGIEFRLEDGIFKLLCGDAANDPERPYFLIVDEINRGDIPRIFGELIMILEKGRRGRPITLPLSRKAFKVPDNVYVIGTMNTADRSIALLDVALRRRFGFLELMPDVKVLGLASPGGVPLGPWLGALNQRICASIGRDARNLQVGHSYLMDGEKPVTDYATFAQILQEDVIPLIEEYCYEDFEALERILGRALVDVANHRIRHEMFNPSRQEELIAALFEPSPDIATSPTLVEMEIENALMDSEEADDGD